MAMRPASFPALTATMLTATRADFTINGTTHEVVGRDEDDLRSAIIARAGDLAAQFHRPVRIIIHQPGIETTLAVDAEQTVEVMEESIEPGGPFPFPDQAPDADPVDVDAVPAFPLFRLDTDAGGRTVFNGTVIEPDEGQTPWQAGLAAVAEAARSRGREAVRVRGKNAAGTSTEGIVTADGHYHSLNTQEPAALPAESPAPKRLALRRILLTSAVLLVLIVIVAVALTRLIGSSSPSDSAPHTVITITVTPGTPQTTHPSEPKNHHDKDPQAKLTKDKKKAKKK